MVWNLNFPKTNLVRSCFGFIFFVHGCCIFQPANRWYVACSLIKILFFTFLKVFPLFCLIDSNFISIHAIVSWLENNNLDWNFVNESKPIHLGPLKTKAYTTNGARTVYTYIHSNCYDIDALPQSRRTLTSSMFFLILLT